MCRCSGPRGDALSRKFSQQQLDFEVWSHSISFRLRSIALDVSISLLKHFGIPDCRCCFSSVQGAIQNWFKVMRTGTRCSRFTRTSTTRSAATSALAPLLRYSTSCGSTSPFRAPASRPTVSTRRWGHATPAPPVVRGTTAIASSSSPSIASGRRGRATAASWCWQPADRPETLPRGDTRPSRLEPRPLGDTTSVRRHGLFTCSG